MKTTNNGFTLAETALALVAAGLLTPSSFTGLILCTAKLLDKVALSVDAQMDDGKGRTGSVRANRATYHQNNGKGKGGGGENPTAVKEVADDYTEDGVTTYVVCRQILL